MEIVVLREPSKSESTRGELLMDGDRFGDTLEDEKRDVKVSGETRIPAGRYRLGLRTFLSSEEEKGLISDMTKKYRKKFEWFMYHIQVMDVPNFSYVYIHVGNYESNTDACLLIGDGFTDYDEKSAIWNSSDTYEEFYKIVVPILEDGCEEVWITYIDHPDDKSVDS